ncbi:YqeB family protein [Amycolatopsis taiwanensis]|uniref:DUF308 domain-containing protein n=1 Tax=Amycolatopsis taiwanensis TaxID=342230 RepID=A0A9W6R0D2_9PSEU|nr:hypothetical protein [Amycolatopsis taiwanensis]GLY66135.1 hypothetical protein Atai01_27540 [Amycolatopsis taiwanensis]
MLPGEQPSGRATVVDPLSVRVFVWLGFPLIGAVVVVAIKLAAPWVVSLPWAPMRGPFELIASVPEPWGMIGAVAVGLVGGLVFGVLARKEALSVTVDDDKVVLTRGDESRELDRGAVGAVFLDGEHLVLLGGKTEELARESGDLTADSLATVFRAHGYRWLDSDPTRDQFRRWVPETPDLDPAANALLNARARALRKSKSGDDAKDLRTELARLGVVVKDQDKKQYWRLAK